MKPSGWVAMLCFASSVVVAQDFKEDLKWRARFDIGGSLGDSTSITEFGAGPISGQEMKLSPGFQFDIGLGYRVTPWLEVGPEIGFVFNSVDFTGWYSYPDTSLFQLPLMANVTLEYPYWGKLAPFVGVGGGGVASFLSFGSDPYWGPDGTGSTFVLGYQAFAGLKYRFSQKFSMGVIYRYTATEDQKWNVEWWTGQHFNVGVDSIRRQSFCLEFQGSF